MFFRQHNACEVIVSPASAEEPEKESHQQQRDEIDPPCHRDQRDAEKHAFKCPFSQPGERERRSRFLKHLGFLEGPLLFARS